MLLPAASGIARHYIGFELASLITSSNMESRTAGFAESITIQSSSSQVFAILSEPQQMIGLQPLLVRCEVVKQQVDERSRTAEYEVFYIERFKILGPLGYDNRIHTFVRAYPDEKRLTFTVRSFPRIELESTYRLSDVQTRTQVDLSVSIKAPAILISMVRKVANSAHLKLLENLKRRCEGRPGA